MSKVEHGNEANDVQWVVQYYGQYGWDDDYATSLEDRARRALEDSRKWSGKQPDDKYRLVCRVTFEHVVDGEA